MRTDTLSFEEKYKLPTEEELKNLRTFMKSTNGRRILRSLFIETASESVKDLEVSEPIFTVKDYNVVKKGKFYWSLKNIYFSYNHVPGFEYEFALDVFGEWEHWNMLADSGDIIKQYIDAWRDEMAIKIQAKALEALALTAISEGSKGTPAAKFLADRGWETKRGRPSKEEVTRERKIAAGVEKQVQEDMERLGITVVQGGKE